MHVRCGSLLRGRVRWILIGWMFAIGSIAYLDRVNISIAGRTIQQEFHLDDIQLGWVFSAFLVGYSVFQTPGGWLADRFGPRRIVALGTVWWGVFTALTALMPAGFSGALAILLAVRFALGIGEAMLYPASNQMVASWIPSQERGVANGVIFAGVGAGAGITPPLITFILLNYGWRWSFWICALIGLAAGAVWFFVARDRPEEHPWVHPEELAHIRAGLPPQPPSSGSRPVVPWGRIFSSKEVLALTLSYFCFGYVAYIFYTWFFIYLSTVRGLDLKSSSYYSMLPFIAMATCSPLGGWIGDRLTKRFGKRVGRCGLAGLGSGVAALFLALGTQAADARFATLVLAGGAGALFLSTSSFWSVTADVGGNYAGTVSGVMNTGCQIAGAVTASLTPVIANHFGWTASFLVAATLCALGALMWLFVDPERRLVGT
jgi:ACS family glucarate transporter-like MFS transporter